jgi:inward rectifier potassium channel
VADAELLASEMNFILSISGLDETSAQMVYARDTFAAQDVRPGHDFVDIFHIDEDGLRHIDFARVHDTRPAAPPSDAPA